MSKNQKGFSIVEGLLILVITGLLAGVGWYVYNSNKRANESLANADKSSGISTKEVKKKTQEQKYKISSGYIVYENKEIGFKFAYPKEYGDFKNATNRVVPSIGNKEVGVALITDKPNPSKIEGSSNGISLSVLKSPDDTFYTVKYGPTVKYTGENLIITEVNPADEVNKVGNEYKNFNGIKEVVNFVRGIKVYHVEGGDEGVTNTKIVFKINSRVVIIELPGFSDGSMCAEVQCNPKDKTEYNEFVENVLNSVSKI